MISIIFVNWNSGEQIVQSILSIEKFHSNLVKEIIVVDNASSDDSMKQLIEYKSSNFDLKTIFNKENKGFAFACNQGAALATADFYLFLNPDTELYQKSLEVPFQFLQCKKNLDVGIVGIQLVDQNSIIARSCTRFPTVSMFFAQIFGLQRMKYLKHLDHFMSNWDHSETRNVDHVIGAFYLIRSKVFKLLSGFDERFFVYLEDLDLSVRSSKAGWKTVFLTETNAFHAGGGTSYQVKAHRLFYSLRSKILYSFKHFSSFEAWLLLVTILIVELMTRLGFSILRLSREDFINTVHGFQMLYADLPNILRLSRQVN
jgi:GT2 family glycosyltransferase